MGRGYRAGRLGEEIRKVASELLIHQLKDPRLMTGMVGVTGVDVSADGSYATIYMSYLPVGDMDNLNVEKAKKDVIEAMEHSKGIIKREIRKHVKIRHIPELLFKYDKSLDYGRRIDELIEQVHKDEE